MIMYINLQLSWTKKFNLYFINEIWVTGPGIEILYQNMRVLQISGFWAQTFNFDINNKIWACVSAVSFVNPDIQPMYFIKPVLGNYIIIVWCGTFLLWSEQALAASRCSYLFLASELNFWAKYCYTLISCIIIIWWYVGSLFLDQGWWAWRWGAKPF
jgi:hypothetical protein